MRFNSNLFGVLTFVDPVVLATPPAREGPVVRTYTRVFVFTYCRIWLLLASVTVQWFISIMYTRIIGEHQQERCCHALGDPFAVAVKINSQVLETYPEKCQLYIPFFKGQMVLYNVELQDKK